MKTKINTRSYKLYNLKSIYDFVENSRKKRGLKQYRNFKTLYKPLMYDFFKFCAAKILKGEEIRHPILGSVVIVKKERKGMQVNFGETRKQRKITGNSELVVYHTNHDFFCIHWYKNVFNFKGIVFKLAKQHERAIPINEDKLRINAKLFKQ
jgi:hypothetical protein